MSENKTTVNEEMIEEIKEFQNLDTTTIEKEVTTVDLNKTTTKGLRITERTKARLNQAEKASGLSQEEFTNKLLDMCDFFEGNDLSKNPELIELTSIVNRIPEIFMGLISKQKTYENGLATKYSNEVDNLKLKNEELSQQCEELKVSGKEEYDKLNLEYEKLKAQSELKIREQEFELDKVQKENTEKNEQLVNLKKNLELTKESLEQSKKEQFESKENLAQKLDEINELREKNQEIQAELLNIKQEKLDIESTIAEYNQKIEILKMQLENAEANAQQQKEMYTEQIEMYKNMISKK